VPERGPVRVTAAVEVVDRLPERRRHALATRAPQLGATAQELDDRLGAQLAVGAGTIRSHAGVLSAGRPGGIGRTTQSKSGIRRIRRPRGERTLEP
jgi:hypothetical protein